jgi:predicted house-cleaning noncanonical NTP pyrophosphatase (MazG superfamily)
MENIKRKKMKLIRDKYIEIISSEKLTKVSSREQHSELLTRKLFEEINELWETGFHSLEEFADVLEVLMAIAKHKGVSLEAVEKIRLKKRDEKGGFEDGVILK